MASGSECVWAIGVRAVCVVCVRAVVARGSADEGWGAGRVWRVGQGCWD